MYIVHSARTSRSIRNQAYYQRTHGRRGASTTELPSLDSALLPLPLSQPTPTAQLPAHLISQALVPLPPSHSFLFQEALASAENLDESDLAQWDADPPYIASEIPSDTPSEIRFTERLVEVMHGRRLRQQRECDMGRNARFIGRTRDQKARELQQEIFRVLGRWQTLELYLPSYKGGAREVRMASHLHEWLV